MTDARFGQILPIFWRVPLFFRSAHMTIVNDDSGVVNKLGASLTDNARFVIYDHHMFIAQATERPLPRTNVLAYTPAASVTKTKKVL